MIFILNFCFAVFFIYILIFKLNCKNSLNVRWADENLDFFSLIKKRAEGP
jgi:hypothetical protein